MDRIRQPTADFAEDWVAVILDSQEGVPTVTVNLNAMLDNFAARLPQVAHAVAMSTDGRVVATTSALPDRCRNRLAAIGASIVSLLDGAATFLESGRMISNIVHMDGGFLFTMSLNPQTALLVVTSADCDVAQIGQELGQLATWAAPDPNELGADTPLTLPSRNWPFANTC